MNFPSTVSLMGSKQHIHIQRQYQISFFKKHSGFFYNFCVFLGFLFGKSSHDRAFTWIQMSGDRLYCENQVFGNFLPWCHCNWHISKYYLSENVFTSANCWTLPSSIKNFILSKNVACMLGGCLRKRRSFGSGDALQEADSLQYSDEQHSESMQSIRPS